MQPNTITMLPGDFLAPSLLSSQDKGRGMVDLLNRVGGVGIQVWSAPDLHLIYT